MFRNVTCQQLKVLRNSPRDFDSETIDYLRLEPGRCDFDAIFTNGQRCKLIPACLVRRSAAVCTCRSIMNGDLCVCDHSAKLVHNLTFD